MHIKKISLKAQTFLEYAVMIAVIIGVFAIAGVYYQRSLQGKYRQAGDAVGGGEQYH